MNRLPLSPRAILAPIVAALLATGIWAGCADERADLTTGPQAEAQRTMLGLGAQELGPALAAQAKYGARLMAIDGVLGHGATLTEGGEAAVVVYLLQSGVRGVPSRLDGVPVLAQVTGLFWARADETERVRPAPIGFSVGHPDITAGTIGARVVDGSGNVFILSNNHVLANSNEAEEGDASLQPGPFDGGSDPADLLGTLFDFEPIDFGGGNNVMDAAVSAVDADSVSGSTPSDEGYGAPGTSVIEATVDMLVQKYGRTTGHTHGEVAAINVTVTVCYEGFAIFCTKSATFVDQISIADGSFSDGGDSGSLIVTDDGNANPVGLLFAGSSTRTIANPIGPVLERFGVTIDPTVPDAPAPTPVTDIAVTDVSAPSSVVQGDVVDVDVTVSNVGNQDVADDIDVTLTDDTDATAIGTQTVSGLAAGASTTLTFSWDTNSASLGDHTLTASHAFADDDDSNDSASTTVNVGEESSGDGISLTATGYKVRGLQKADLEWSGATSTDVDVIRDATTIATTANDGFYTDNIDARGGGSYTYQVCEAGTTTCSNEATVTF